MVASDLGRETAQSVVMARTKNDVKPSAAQARRAVFRLLREVFDLPAVLSGCKPASALIGVLPALGRSVHIRPFCLTDLLALTLTNMKCAVSHLSLCE